MKTQTVNLAEGLAAEIERVTTILGHYIEIGPAGSFGAMLIRASLKRAVDALASGDVVQMLTANADLKEYSE
ncbi:conserved hypothetical protein [Paraburkholderia caribensis]|uniref:hypothetical protein n=1 Tax=Paraburkholderia caribensis TaxID=75105 RepID=UPI001CAA9641|nr:hypothetical protein [Paraburkholderia caribensis]CAG9193958.1 conserved hypothetical protein [Paraburkholderia caribensis]